MYLYKVVNLKKDLPFKKDLQNRIQRGKKAPDFSRGDELPLCMSTILTQKSICENGF